MRNVLSVENEMITHKVFYTPNFEELKFACVFLNAVRNFTVSFTTEEIKRIRQEFEIAVAALQKILEEKQEPETRKARTMAVAVDIIDIVQRYKVKIEGLLMKPESSSPTIKKLHDCLKYLLDQHKEAFLSLHDICRSMENVDSLSELKQINTKINTHVSIMEKHSKTMPIRMAALYESPLLETLQDASSLFTAQHSAVTNHIYQLGEKYQIPTFFAESSKTKVFNRANGAEIWDYLSYDAARSLADSACTFFTGQKYHVLNIIKQERDLANLPPQCLEIGLRIAAELNLTERLEFLLAKTRGNFNVNVNVHSVLLRRTALHWAARNGSEEQIKLLLKRGAKPMVTDVYGNTPLMTAPKESNAYKLLEEATLTSKAPGHR